LENIIQRSVALEQSKIILPESLKLASHKQQEAAGSGVSMGFDLPMEGFELEKWLDERERGFIRQALGRTRGVKTEAARLLGISFRSLRYRMEKLGMD
jgi:two-component system response regulator PilR (NtrC family)